MILINTKYSLWNIENIKTYKHKLGQQHFKKPSFNNRE